jgi:hypothetical protein
MVSLAGEAALAFNVIKKLKASISNVQQIVRISLFLELF